MLLLILSNNVYVRYRKEHSMRKVSKCAMCMYCKGRANPPRFWKCGANFEKFVAGDPDGEPFELDEKGNAVLTTDPCPDYKNEWDYKRK